MNLLEIRQLFSSSLEPSSEINLVKTTLESHSHEIPHQNHLQNKCYKTVTSEITFKNATKHNWEREALIED
jgi:hypothetical protein